MNKSNKASRYTDLYKIRPEHEESWDGSIFGFSIGGMELVTVYNYGFIKSRGGLH